MGRILGIDFGMKRIGLALSDPSKIIASPLKSLQAGKSLEQTADLILLELTGVESIVLGLPLLLSGKDSETTETVRKFAAILEAKSQLPLILWDERLTTTQVEKILKEGNMRRKKRAQHLDTMSATLILQSYLDRMHHGS
ncbi:MAG: Holliday junction resolvase RuvX [Simkaniaceae bacterium]|jgi:putative Holliday junction resolvase